MRKLLAAFLVLAVALPAAAQQPAAQPNTQPDTQLTGWQRVMVLQPRTSLYVYDQTGHKLCNLQNVDAQTLNCDNGGALSYPRAEVLSVKLPRRTLSGWVAEGIAFTAAIIAAAAIGHNGSEGEDGNLGAQFAVVFFGFVGLIAAPFIGHHVDFMRKTVYKAP